MIPRPKTFFQDSYPSSSFAAIHTKILVNNVNALKALCPNIAPVVKADAYGLGAVPVVKTLVQAGLKEFFVSFFEEGVNIRRYVPGDYLIYVLNDVKNYSLKDFQEYKLIPVLYDKESVMYWQQEGNGFPCVLHFDTGMHRTGLPLGADVSDLNIVLVMSHLCASEKKDDAMNLTQLNLFKSLQFPGVRLSLANSGGIFLGEDFHFDLARPGIACYGFDNFDCPMIQNCLRIYAPIVQIDHVKEGFVGYNMTYAVEKPMTIATLGIGYGDGVPHELSYVCIGNMKAPVVGRVSMDLMTVDISDVPESFWSEPAYISQEWPGFAYQYALKLTPRLKKIYVE